MIGVRGLMNDYYAKDIGKKIRAGYRQKQKEGGVITPPFGYWNGSRRVEYVYRGYHRNGKDDCTSHRIREEVLDKTVWDYTKQKEILRLGQKIDKLVMEKIRIQQ